MSLHWEITHWVGKSLSWCPFPLPLKGEIWRNVGKSDSTGCEFLSATMTENLEVYLNGGVSWVSLDTPIHSTNSFESLNIFILIVYYNWK